MKRVSFLSVCLLVLAAILQGGAAAGEGVPSPRDHLGFRIGTDRKLADYTEVVAYLERLAESSPWIEIRDIGQTTLGKRFVMAVISTPDNLKNLDRYVAISRRLADPRTLAPGESESLIADGKLLVMITCNLHSTEVASAQMALELAYDAAAGRNETLTAALEETVLFLIPSLNPDGLQMVVDWYEKWAGTEYDGCRMPWLYHQYAGHDNNRDWYMGNLAETRAVFDLYFRTVVPHVILDMHQMWSTGARLFLPQFYPPANVNVDPIVYREVGLLGYFMQLECEERDLSGVISDAYFTGYWEGSSMMTPWWHNQVGLLSEAASVNVATPVFVEEVELRGDTKGFPRYEHRINFPNPWPGGWWRLRDIVDYELAIAEGLMDCCAAHRERFLDNFHMMGKRAVERGKSEPPYGFVFPAPYRDPVRAARLVEALMLGGVEVHRATADFMIGNRLYRAGSFVIRSDQPYRAYIKDLLEVQDYPDIRASEKEPFIRPYDVTGWTMWMNMDVPCEEIDEPFDAELEPVEEYPYPVYDLPGGDIWGYALSPAANVSYSAANVLLEEGLTVYRTDEAFDPAVEGSSDRDMHPAGTLEAGQFVLPLQAGLERIGPALAREHHARFIPLREEPPVPLRRLHAARTALFKPWRASADEGWTRLLFDTYRVPYRNVGNKDIAENKIERYDALVLPDVSPSIIKDGEPSGEWARFDRPLPPEYTGGIGKDGTEHIKEFVEKGGTLICFNSSCAFAIEAFGLPVQNVLEKVGDEEFYCPGTILKVSYKQGHPLTYGMPANGYIQFNRGPAFRTSLPYGKFERTVLASYTDKDPRGSGLLIGGEKLYRNSALVEMRYGTGRIVLFGFSPQHRCQTHGTYRLVFNALIESNAEHAPR